MPTGNRAKKPKVVIDTNVFISGLNFDGKPRKILNLIWKEEIIVCISLFILKEIEKVLEEDFGWDKEQIRNTIERIKDKTEEVKPDVKISVIKDKVNDNCILECAVTGNAEYIVSGDKHHILPLKKYLDIKILSPDEFLEVMLLNLKNY
ncbi:MAG: putative toxin-antitoxin system toxin component, PIN family [Actinobacteria bacterium]|nr:putative toxin-antitoxin system toxin component, PIN family [Cyanobacteriota bacterium]MCL5771660.1 putative toxin-antitoxin system toxin component, PIN family [Actinomycetota bacterium]